jgi:hypothetical protein
MAQRNSEFDEGAQRASHEGKVSIYGPNSGQGAQQERPGDRASPSLRAFLDAVAELLLDHVLAKRQNPACTDPFPQCDVRTARSNPLQDRSGGSL